MRDIISETRAFIEASMKGDPALSSLEIKDAGPSLTATIAPGRPPAAVGRVTYSPAPPFARETLVELIIRMQRIRWSRYDSYTLSMKPAGREDLVALRQRYSFSTTMSVGEGWHDLLAAQHEWLAALGPGGDFAFSDLKEKFGSLRAYTWGAFSDLCTEIIDASEHLSAHVCDVCGAPGRTRGRGWISTRCDDHKEEGDE